MARLTGMILIFVMINVFMFMWGIGDSDNIMVRYIQNPSNISLSSISEIFKEVATVNLGTLIAGGVSTIAGIATGSAVLLFAGVALVFFSYALMLTGAISVFPNPVIGWLIISPLMLLFWLIVLEWWKGD